MTYQILHEKCPEWSFFPSTYAAGMIQGCIYQEVSAAVNALRVVGIVWTDPGTHNVFYHEDNIDLCSGEEVVHQPEMTAIFGHGSETEISDDT